MNFGRPRITLPPSLPPPVCLDEVGETVLAMQKQEATLYNYRNFLPMPGNGLQETRLNSTWREKICQWSYNVVDHFDLSREVVAISLDLFDRYMATKGNRCSGCLALLVSLTTLHIAIKLFESKKIKLSTLANLSRGQFCPKHIEEMEWEILHALEWKIHPPSQYSFVSNLLLFLPQEANPTVRNSLSELTKYLTELAVCDSYFIDVPNSVVAFAAILNIMEDMNYTRLSGGLREKFLRDLHDKVGLSCYSRPVILARQRLRKTFAASDNNAASMLTASASRSEMLVHTNGHSANETGSQASMSSAGSVTSFNSYGRANHSLHARSRTNSFDSKSSTCRYSPNTRRPFVAAVSPMTTSRARLGSSPIMAGTH